MNRHLSAAAVCGIAALSLSLSLVATSPASASPQHHEAVDHAGPTGTVTWAEGPETPPTYIFPLVSSVNSWSS
jgi:hypothetical protein